MTHNLAILKALSYGECHSTPLIEQARRIYSNETGRGMSACSTNRLRELRKKELIASIDDFFSVELKWCITEQGRKYLEEKMRVFQ